MQNIDRAFELAKAITVHLATMAYLLDPENENLIINENFGYSRFHVLTPIAIYNMKFDEVTRIMQQFHSPESIKQEIENLMYLGSIFANDHVEQQGASK